jgi:hypothetical protein
MAYRVVRRMINELESGRNETVLPKLSYYLGTQQVLLRNTTHPSGEIGYVPIEIPNRDLRNTKQEF